MHRLLLVFLGLTIGWAHLPAQGYPDPTFPVPADRAGHARRQNWLEAKRGFDAEIARLTDWRTPAARRAVQGSIGCAVKLERWDEALALARQFVERTPGSFEEAVGLRLLASLHRQVPGSRETRARDERGQLVTPSVMTRMDRAQAVRCYERAREVLERLAVAAPDGGSGLRAERIGLAFDLAGLLGEVASDAAGRCAWWWAPKATSAADSTEESDSFVRDSVVLDVSGAPRALEPLPAYDSGASEARRVLFLLAEVERLDTEPRREDAAKAAFRRATIYGTLFDPYPAERVLRTRMEQEPTGPRGKEKLTEDEALVLVDGEPRKIRLPFEQNPFELLRIAQRSFPGTSAGRDAAFLEIRYFTERHELRRAEGLYERFLERHPRDAAVGFVRRELQSLRQPGVQFLRGGLNPVGLDPQIVCQVRNARQIEFRAYRLKPSLWLHEWQQGNSEKFWKGRAWRRLVVGAAKTWQVSVPDDGGHQTTEHRLSAPLNDPGAYVIEASVRGGREPARTCFVRTELAALHRSSPGRCHVFLLHLRTGQPLPGRKVVLLAQPKPKKSGEAASPVRLTAVTDADGHADWPVDETWESSQLLAEQDDGSIALTDPLWIRKGDDAARVGHRTLFLTDRPVYRPGDTVRVRLWLREHDGSELRAATAGRRIALTLAKSESDSLRTEGVLDEDGGLSAEFSLPPAAALGEWTLSALDESKRRLGDFGSVRVEEFRKPEFEVEVRLPQPAASFGQRFKATVSARYLFGAPVAQGRVTYRVSRSSVDFDYDALVRTGWRGGGEGARPERRYDWLPWSKAAATRDRGTADRLIELKSGEAKTSADGTVEIEIDPQAPRSPMKPDRLYRLTVEVEMRDSSRRIQTARAVVLQSACDRLLRVHATSVWQDAPGPFEVEVGALQASGAPAAAEGELDLLRLVYRDKEPVAREEPVATWSVSIGPEGRQILRCATTESGQYRLRFRGRDSRGEAIEANDLIWVGGPGFDGRRLRFKELEIITDKAVYRAGETARVLLTTRFEDAHVLLADDFGRGQHRSWKMLAVSARARLFDLPLTARDVPERWLHAECVRNGERHSAKVPLAVRRPELRLEVTLQTDRPSYRPGESGQVRVRVRTPDGQPAKGVLTLAGWDDALKGFAFDAPPLYEQWFGGLTSYVSLRGSDSLEWKAWTYQRWDELRRPWTRTYGFWPIEEFGFGLGDWSRSDPTGYGARLRREPPRWKDSGLDEELRFGEPARVVVTGSYIPTAESEGPLPVTTYGAAPEEGLRQLPSFVGANKEERTTAETALRSDFADTLLWAPSLRLGPDGTASADFRLPDSVTRWRFEAVALGPSSQVGEGRTTTATRKNILVRLQAPRFAIERDEVVLSTIVHNYLAQPQKVRVELRVPQLYLEPLDPALAAAAQRKVDDLVLSAEVTIPAGGEQRLDWPMRVRMEGRVDLVARALSEAESDAVRIVLPLHVHGAAQQVARSGGFGVGATGTRSLTFTLPAEIVPGRTRLDLTLAPSVAQVMVDALPFLIEYPHGCVEQTISRFYPVVVAQGALRRAGVDLRALAELAKRDPRRARQFGTEGVFDEAQIEQLAQVGLRRLLDLRQYGAWGWWSQDGPSLLQTAYVLQGLLAARAAGLQVPEEALGSALDYLAGQLGQRLSKRGKTHVASSEEAFAVYALSLGRKEAKVLPAWLDLLYAQRGQIGQQGRAQLALALRTAGRLAEARLVVGNLRQFVERNAESGTAALRTPTTDWWRWHRNDVETNAWFLRALVAVEPRSELAPQVVRWLVGNRAGGAHWRSTRDTALAIVALDEYLRASGEEQAGSTVEVAVDGKPHGRFGFARGGFRAEGERIVLEGTDLAPGEHTITLTKTGGGALYYGARLEWVSLAPEIAALGGDLRVERSYFRVGRVGEKEEFTPIRSGDVVKSGEEIEVVLRLQAANDYDFLAFEDRKPAGCEPVRILSGSTYADGFCANVELRDDRVVFYAAELRRGERSVTYRLRAETPGAFRAPPTTGFAMYAPELRANSATHRLRVSE